MVGLKLLSVLDVKIDWTFDYPIVILKKTPNDHTSYVTAQVCVEFQPTDTLPVFCVMSTLPVGLLPRQGGKMTQMRTQMAA